MDSMRSLNTSLPVSSPPKQATNEPPEVLLQAFKAAALSVTTLYKLAAAEPDRARKEGYQEALDDLLQFLDRENLGLGDGEGWRIRQWATAGKAEGRDCTSGATASDSDDERAEAQKRARSLSPAAQRTGSLQEQQRSQQATRQPSPVRTGSAPPAVTIQQSTPPPPPPSPPQQQQQQIPFARPDLFTFRSPISLPQHSDSDIELPDHDIFSSSSPPQPINHDTLQFQQQPSTPSLRLEVVPRTTRSSARLSTHNTRSMTNSRSSTSIGALGTGAGFKRRLPFGEFFDLGSLESNRKDGFGGGSGAKRGRLS
ncbi:hypothetical protein GP486_003965 [Trichoglossum hirsutum]|uniref:Uncharacterized protein n=1 Tax=Trichoglossum hirsutum TaxID=265104 RepID=A0A9P8LC26_9PEZI|nr:hypothetical protein GP486_003965 [Trichoglossum hirsutum]